MKHIGIIACSAEGAALCYRAICQRALEYLGEHDHPRVTLDSIPMAATMPYFRSRDMARVAAVLRQSLETLAEGKVIRGVVKNITDYGAFIELEEVSGGSLAERMHTSRAQVDRILKVKGNVTVESLQRAAALVGRELRLELV